MYILSALGIVAVLWFVVKPRMTRKSPDAAGAADKVSKASKHATAKTRKASKQATAKAGQMYQGLRGRFKLRSDTRELAKRFQHWGTGDASPMRAALASTLPSQAEDFAAWIGRLSEQELRQFTEQVARYCATMNFDLAWLTDAQVSNEPKLKQAVEGAVLLHSLGAWRANSVQQDVQIFLAYRAWIANPHQHKAFGQELHGVLIQRGLVTVPPELFLAPEKERLEQATMAIRKVAYENPAAFHLVLRQLAGASEEPLPAAPVPTSASPAPVPAAS